MAKLAKFLSGFSAMALVAGGAAGETKWIKNPEPAQKVQCFQLCLNSEMRPVFGGSFDGGKGYYPVCVADRQGARPGHEPPGHHAGTCSVEYNGQGQNPPPFACLCSTEKIRID